MPQQCCISGFARGHRWLESPSRLAQRNGYRDSIWETRVGTDEMRTREQRKGSYFAGFLGPRRMAEKALTAAVHQACVQGSRASMTGGS
ncbi:Transposase, Mutator family [Bradyrhizobium brasilense]|uniref:Transposase, Mutator family n=1 Tax=Bradyrhizobium brasilense TaxID=1419277 RepID=A0A1G6U2G5_9BRAD|nr:Transposase, Mutator family [Bradyrhizobium brasilense]